MSFNNHCKQEKFEKLIASICNCEYEYFLNKANVVGIGCGYKVQNGFYTDKLCIKVFVSRKFPKNSMNSYDVIPLTYKSIPTDVKETGYFTACSLTQRIRPILGGYVIGNEYDKDSSGTLGCLVTDGKDLFILGNNHTLATSNKAPIGTKIIQPSSIYNGDFQKDVIGTLCKYIPLKFKTFFRNPVNYVDCALGKITDKNSVSPKIAFIGIPKGVANALLNQDVKKVGFKTELTTGKIEYVESTFEMILPFGKTSILKKQILTTKMSDRGDSGSILLNIDNYAIGLLTAQSTAYTVFNPIGTVLEQLNVHLVTSKNYCGNITN